MARSKPAADLSDKSNSPAFASLSAGDVLRGAVAKQSTSLTLRPLLKPFKGRGRLFLRIEKMPQQATLSAGQRNGDGSWSLASDELEDLTYLMPSSVARDHALTIRVVALDGGEATTLKVHDFPVSFSGSAAQAASQAPQAANEAAPADDTNYAVPNELGKMHSLFAVREAEVEQLRAAVERERREREQDAERLQQHLQKEFEQRLEAATARHQQELEAQRATLESQFAALTSAGGREKEREAGLARQRLQKEFDERLEAATARHQQELETQRGIFQSQITALTSSARREREGDAELVQQRLQKEFEQKSSAAAAQHQKQLDAERAVLQAKIAELAAGLDMSEQRLQKEFEQKSSAAATRHQMQWDAERATLQAKITELAAGLDMSEQRLQKEFDQKSSAAGLRHQMQSDAERAVLQAKITELAAGLDASEQRLREERQSREAYAAGRALEVEQKWKAVHDKSMDSAQHAAADVEAQLLSARTKWETDQAAALRQAREAWGREQEALLKQLQEQHRQQRNDLIAAERAKIAMLEAALAAAPGEDHDAGELDFLKEQLAAARRVLADCELELKEAKAQLERERAAKAPQADQPSQQERDAWQATENALRQQLTTIQTQADAQIAHLTKKCQDVEAIASRNSWSTAVRDKAQIDNLNLEIASLRSALSAQDRANSALRMTPSRNAEVEEQREAEGAKKKTLVKEFCLVVACVTPLIIFYPQLMSFVHQFTASDSDDTALSPPPPAKPDPKANAAKTRMATVLRGVNVRQTPSTKADVAFTLKKGATVEIVSTSGKWIEIGVKSQAGAKDQPGAMTRGWVFSTYLRADEAGAAPGASQ